MMNVCIFYIEYTESSAISTSTISQIKLLSCKIYIAFTEKFNEVLLSYVTRYIVLEFII